MGLPNTICGRWIYALSDSCLFHGWSDRNRSKANFRADSDSEARAFILFSLFGSARHTPNSVEKKTPNNLETHTLEKPAAINV
jgi:hypothetical protein